MSVEPFWVPERYSELVLLIMKNALITIYAVPIVGMLCGNTISGVVVSITYVLKELKQVPCLHIILEKKSADLQPNVFQ